jgi:tRNA A58 N-methylase Trm61
MKRGVLVVALCCLGAAIVFSQQKSSKAGGDQPKRTPDVIFVPTPQGAVDKMLELAEVKKGDVVYDLGCGDGRIVVTAAKKFGAKGIGIDIDPERIAESRENVRTNGVEKLVTIKNADIFEEDFRDASVITLYLLPSLNVKLIPQFDKLKPGTRIVSYQFNMDGVKPKETYTGNGSYTIYKWVTPLDKEARSQ